MLRHFGLCVGLLVGLYYGLGHFSVVELWSIQVVFKKKHRKYQAKRNFWVALLMFLMFSFLFRVFPFSWGMLHLGYAGFISSSC